MVSNIILAVILLWASAFAFMRVRRFMKQAKSCGAVQCSCSGCPGCGAARK